MAWNHDIRDIPATTTADDKDYPQEERERQSICCRWLLRKAFGMQSLAYVVLLKGRQGQCEESGNGFDTAPEPTEPLPPAKGKWLAKEN